MRKKMYWGIVTLIILILGVTAVLLLRDTDTEPEVIYKTDVEPARKTETPIAEKPTAREGFEMVQHGDHWHEVPIDEPEIMQDEPTTQSDSVKPYTGPLTYHKELLKTHPVEALRKQAEERGHWSAKWIPPFPPDDTEAAEIAKAVYIWVDYYIIKGNSDKDPRPPEIAHAIQVTSDFDKKFWETFDPAQRADPRTCDLLKLIWARRNQPIYRAFIWTSTFDK